MAARLKAIVIGGSLGGLAAAAALRAVGCEAQIFERSPVSLQDRGAGIRMRAVMQDLLERRGGLKLGPISTTVRLSRHYHPGRPPEETAHAAEFTAWASLNRVMSRLVPPETCHLGATFVGLSQDGDGVEARFADGRVERGDLLVFADGINSTGRRRLFPDREPAYAGYVCWRGCTPEGEVAPAAWKVLQNAVNVALLAPGYFGCYPIPGPDGSIAEARRVLNWVWYRSVAAGPEFDELMTDRAGVFRPSSLAAGQVQDRYVREIHQAAQMLPAPLAELVRKTREPFIQTICDVEVPRMAVGRACLIGDAAFGGRPHLGAGTAKAAVDAWALADALSAHDFDVPVALSAWDSAQRPIGQAFVDENRRLGASFQCETPPDSADLRPDWTGATASAIA